MERKEAIEVVKNHLPHSSFKILREALETLIPELKKSEDENERIRKSIIDIIKSQKEQQCHIDGTVFDEMITWLEKLSEKQDKKVTWNKEDERLCQCLIEDQEEALDEVRNDEYGHSEIISDLKEMYGERIKWLKSLKDKIGI